MYPLIGMDGGAGDVDWYRSGSVGGGYEGCAPALAGLNGSCIGGGGGGGG